MSFRTLSARSSSGLDPPQLGRGGAEIRSGDPENGLRIADLMETIPALMQFIRTETRSQREAFLSVPQFRVLVYLNRHPDASLSELVDHLSVTRALASTMVDRLVKQGYVDRSDHPQERRLVMLRLTPIGTERLLEMRQITRQTMAALLEQLSPTELGQVKAGLELLNRVFNA